VYPHGRAFLQLFPLLFPTFFLNSTPLPLLQVPLLLPLTPFPPPPLANLRTLGCAGEVTEPKWGGCSGTFVSPSPHDHLFYTLVLYCIEVAQGQACTLHHTIIKKGEGLHFTLHLCYTNPLNTCYAIVHFFSFFLSPAKIPPCFLLRAPPPFF